MDSNDVLSEKLLKAWRFFFAKGFIDGFGHISARTSQPDRVLLSRHNLGKEVASDDFVLVDLEGQQIGSSAPLPGETPIHLEIYRSRPDVGGVAHFHTTFSTSFSMSDQQLRPTYFPAAIFRKGIPIHPDSRLVNTKERGVALAATLGDHRAALMKAHGIVVTGCDVEEMVASVFIMEDNAYRTWVTAAMGPVHRLSDEALSEIEDEVLKTRGPFRRIWALCESFSDKG